MLRAAWRALGRLGASAPARPPASRPPGGWCAGPERERRGLPAPAGGLILQLTRGYTTRKPVQVSQDDIAPSTLLRDYQNVPGIEKVDDNVRRILSLEMANQKEKLKVKKDQLMSKIVANPEDTSSLEARIVALTVKILSYEAHMEKYRKDKANKRSLLMSIDQRNKMLKHLRETNFDVFEKTCRELGIEYTIPPLYNRKPHRRMLAKRTLCLKVFQEVQKLKKQRRALKAATAAQRAKLMNLGDPSKAEPETVKENQKTLLK